MKIKLVTDYLDFYDHAFYPDGDVTYTRNVRNGLLRRDMFKLMEHYGFKTVEHGVVSGFVPSHIEALKQQGIFEEPAIQLSNTLDNVDKTTMMLEEQVRQARNDIYKQQAQVVVYTDEYAHRGEGKEVMAYWDALEKFPDAYCSQFYQTTIQDGSFSERLLFVGSYGFRIQYHSNDWRSNVGETQIAVTERFNYPVEKTNIPHPIFAVDFITENNLAVDFNTSPGLDCIKKYVTPTEVYMEVEKWFELNPVVLIS